MLGENFALLGNSIVRVISGGEYVVTISIHIGILTVFAALRNHARLLPRVFNPN